MRMRSAISLVVWLTIGGPAWSAEPVAPDDAVVPSVHERLHELEAQVKTLQQTSATANALPPMQCVEGSDCTGCGQADCEHCGRGVCPNCGHAKANCTCVDPWFGSGSPKVRLTGFFQLDAAYYDQDSASSATLGDIADGLSFRRARVAAAGDINEYTSFIVEFDFAQAQARFVDVWMQLKETPLGNMRIGRFRQPFGMNELTSIRELPFLERPLMFAMGPFRQTGVMLFDTAFDDQATWAVSGYRYNSDNFGDVYTDTGGYGLASRVTALLVDGGDNRIVHVGADYSYNDPGNTAIRYASTNEVFVGQSTGGVLPFPASSVPPFVDTGENLLDRTSLFNLEGAASLGQALLQSEVRWNQVQMSDGTWNTFPSAYAHARYMLTGEVIPYNRQGGVFGRVKPRNPVSLRTGGIGAWEVAGRVSHLDLNGAGIAGPGRRLTDYTFGLNWYLNDFTKFQFNYIRAQLDDPTLGDSSTNTLAVRGQLDF